MNPHFTHIILRATGASACTESEVIQNLWSGYGKIIRCSLQDSDLSSVVVKHVQWPDSKNHPRGWNTDLSHERKVKSYQVETEWYAKWAGKCDESCRVPACFALETHGDEVFMVMEDLDASGFGERRTSVADAELQACLSWLANFHATFMGKRPVGLWKTGTYWHLETRPEELNELDDQMLKLAAPSIDRKLSGARYLTLVHGDAKLANFCFTPDGKKVAAVDFQYVGGGCGMKDVAYFLGSCLSEEACDARETALLDYYFTALKQALEQRERSIDFDDLEAEWRALYPVAWTDFFRFLQGWSPGHWKIHAYSRRLAKEVLETL